MSGRAISISIVYMLLACTSFGQEIKWDKSEFEFAFNKNGRANGIITPKEDYLTLFVNYKLKVAEAKEMGLDTTANYISECKGYYDELARSYMTDSASVNRLINTTIDRFYNEIHAAHILIQMAPDASAADTTKAFQRIDSIRNCIMAGEDFSNLAMKFSEDPSARTNSGDLGFFSALQMVTQFEDMAYSTKIGEVSPIFRSSFGYHILKVFESRPFHQIRVAHIMKAVDKKATETEKNRCKYIIDSIYQRLKAGEDFQTLAKNYSDDKQSGARGGEMPWLSRGRIILEFENPAFAITEINGLSPVIETPFGYHIIKLIETRDSVPQEMLRNNIERALQQQGRDKKVVSSAIASRVRKSHNVVVDNNNWNILFDIIVSNSPDSTKQSRLNNNKELALITVDKDVITARELNIPINLGSQSLFSEVKESLVNIALCNYYKEHLIDDNKEFRISMQEYYDGPLIFEINQRLVWNKDERDMAIIDSLYMANPKRYKRGGEFDGSIYICDSSKDAKRIQSLLEKGKTIDKSLYKELICGVQKQGDRYDDYLWPLTPSSCVVINGTYTDGVSDTKEEATQKLQADLMQVKEKELATKLRKKYRIKRNPAF
mgnify:CR=1 FL=1